MITPVSVPTRRASKRSCDRAKVRQQSARAAICRRPDTINSPSGAYLSLYGTGIAGRSSLDAVRCAIGGTSLPVGYAGPTGGWPGLDQVNVRLTAAVKANLGQRINLAAACHL